MPPANQPPGRSSTDTNGLAQNPNFTSSTPSIGSRSDPSAATPRIRPIFDECDHTAAVLLSRGGGGDGGEGDGADGAPLSIHDTQKHPDQPSPPFHAGPLTKARRSSRSSSRSSTPVKSESSTPVFGNSSRGMWRFFFPFFLVFFFSPSFLSFFFVYITNFMGYMATMKIRTMCFGGRKFYPFRVAFFISRANACARCDVLSCCS